MNRRAFFRRFGGVIAAVAVAQKVVPELLSKLVQPRPDTFLFADRFADDIYQHVHYSGSYKSIWLTLVKGGKFPEGYGAVEKSITSWSAE